MSGRCTRSQSSAGETRVSDMLDRMASSCLAHCVPRFQHRSNSAENVGIYVQVYPVLAEPDSLWFDGKSAHQVSRLTAQIERWLEMENFIWVRVCMLKFTLGE
ncbi:hypothetical protein OBBRIDRAFT_458712 [Obba rivulosa]|uniref:Uncharacterized protein n=1 Tax=Obba rivulosa TaxID=1052685 RepID=A0A8E2DEK2_9APHY|nr:hypothetical protein OBBRIDRAFT_458712 [Obba rivulosa]